MSAWLSAGQLVSAELETVCGICLEYYTCIKAADCNAYGAFVGESLQKPTEIGWAGKGG